MSSKKKKTIEVEYDFFMRLIALSGAIGQLGNPNKAFKATGKPRQSFQVHVKKLKEQL